MALYRLENTETGEVKRLQQLDRDSVKLMKVEPPWVWKKGLPKSVGKPAVGSLTHVLRLMDCEGFTDHTLNQIQKFTLRDEKQTAARSAARLETKRKFSELMREQSLDHRKTVTKFITTQCGMSFQAGIKVGLSAGLVSSWWEDSCLESDADEDD